MKRTGLPGVVACLALTAWLPAQQTGDNEAPSAHEGERSGRFDREDERFERGERRGIDPEQWKLVVAFFEKHAPRRLELYRDVTHRLAGEQVLLDRARFRVWRKYLQIERLADRPELQAFAVRQLELEDAVIGRVLELRKQQQPLADDAELRQAVRAIVEYNLNERRRRLDELEARLKAHRAQLEEQAGNIEAVVDRRLEEFIDAAPDVEAFERVLGGRPEGRDSRERDDKGQAPRDPPRPTND